MTLYGPPGITKLYNAMRTFINVRDLGLRAVEFQGVLEQPAIITDPMFAITPVVLSAEEKQGEVGDGGHACCMCMLYVHVVC